MSEFEPVFRNCNVCGRSLIRNDEMLVGVCAICANEETPSRKNWGQVYRSALARGWDHGWAAFSADEWEKRRKKKESKKN